MGSPAIEVKCGDGIWSTREKGLRPMLFVIF